MGGGSKTTTTNEKRDPWAPAQPALNTALSGAMDAYNTTYNGPQIAGMDPNVTQGQDAILANANSGTIGNLAGMTAGNLGSVLGNGGMAAGSQDAMSGIGSSLGQFNQTLGNAQSYLDPYASGQMRDNNPYLNASIENAMSQAANGVNRQFSAAGRYGSGAQADALGSSLGRIATDARMNAYNTDTQNQLSAINGLGNLATSGLSGNISGQGAMANIGQQGYANTLNGLNSLGTLNSAQNADAQNMTTVGAQKMDYQQQLIDAANSAPWAKVGNLASIAGGIGGLGGTASGVSTTKEDTGIGGILGGITGGIGALANIGKAAGGFSSLFALSDKRAKENIEPVGKLDNGQKVYAYNYLGDSKPQIGLLAQEVEKTHPNAVREFNGLKHVNYGEAVKPMKKKVA